jgi:hypothetical protein
MTGSVRMAATLAAFAILSLSLLACGPRLLARQATPTAVVTAGEADVVIHYSRSGGIAGVDDDYTIYADGRVVNAKGSARAISPEMVQELVQQAEKVGFFSFRPEEGPGNNLCNDCFNYSLTITAGGRSNTLELIDTQESVPDGIWDLVRAVQEAVAPPQ